MLQAGTTISELRVGGDAARSMSDLAFSSNPAWVFDIFAIGSQAPMVHHIELCGAHPVQPLLVPPTVTNKLTQDGRSVANIYLDVRCTI